MSKVVRLSFVAALLVLSLVSSQAFAQTRTSAVDRQELRSGAAIGPDEGAAALSLQSPSLARSKRSADTASSKLVGPNVRVNEDQIGLFGRSETTIAAQGNGQKLVAGWNDAQGFCGVPFGSACTPPTTPGLSGFGYSSDWGETWTDGGAPPVFYNAITRGDPWLDSGGKNGSTFYYANLAVTADTAAALGIIVHRGRFTGNSFAWYDAQIFDSPRNAITPNSDFYDKEALVAAKDGSKAVYVSVTNFQELCGNPQFGFGQIEVWSSHDGGDSWQGPAIAGPEAPDSVADCGFSGTLQQTSVPAIGPKGEVYVVWQYGPYFAADGSTSADADIVVARSLDGGVTFEPFVKVADINSLRQNTPVGYNRERINDHPRIAVATSGPDRGRVFVVFYSSVSPVGGVSGTTQTLISSQVYLSYSDDQGLSWSAPMPVAPATPDSGVKRFWPVVTLQKNGFVDVVYYESLEQQATANPTDIECNVSIGGGRRRTGTNSSLVDVYWVQSVDGGASFGAPVRVSDVTSNWCTTLSNIRPNFGDYIGSASGASRVFPVWADGRNGIPDVFFSNIKGR